MREVGGKITAFQQAFPSVCFFFNHIFTENFIEIGEDVSKTMSPKLGESLDLMFSVQQQGDADNKQLLIWVCDRIFGK